MFHADLRVEKVEVLSSTVQLELYISCVIYSRKACEG